MAPTDHAAGLGQVPPLFGISPGLGHRQRQWGANALWLSEWLADGLELKPGLRVLDLGCGRATSSIFLQRSVGS